MRLVVPKSVAWHGAHTVRYTPREAHREAYTGWYTYPGV